MPATAPVETPVTPILRLRGIGKRFGPIVANDAISLDLARGEVLALLGENGAGKSTLMSILFGHYVADEGTIEVDGRPLPPGQPRAALAAGIGMVHQHFTLADNLSVLDNVMLGTEPLWWPWSRRAAARARLAALARRFGLAVDPDARVGDLSVGERQRVEILKALGTGGVGGDPAGAAGAAGAASTAGPGARILILDEPTAVLTPQESESLFATLGRLVAQGLAVIFISHKLDEVLRVSHRIAVLRGGRLVADLPTAGASQAGLAEAMVGRRVAPPLRRERPLGAVVCALPDTGLAVHAGEIVAVAGVAGNGQQALAERLAGLAGPGRAAAAPETGETTPNTTAPAPHAAAGRAAQAVWLDGRPLPASPRAFVAAGVARIPEDRHAVGLVGDLPLWENAVLETYASPRFSRGGIVRREAARAFAADIIERFDVRGGGLDSPARALSGGNMQKLILGRALRGAQSHQVGGAQSHQVGGAQSHQVGGAQAHQVGGAQARQVGGAPTAQAGGVPRLILADQPTWGLDIGAVAYVHQQLLDAAAAGSAVLLISEDLDEIFALADRVAVMHQGRLGPARPVAEWTQASIGLAMAGAQSGAAGTGPVAPRAAGPGAAHAP